MRPSRNRIREFPLGFRVLMVGVGLLICAIGIATLKQGRIEYLNYRGVPMSAYFALLIGALAIFVGLKGHRSK